MVPGLIHALPRLKRACLPNDKSALFVMNDTVFLFDVDNTLLDNDRIIEDLSDYLLANLEKKRATATGKFLNDFALSRVMRIISAHWSDIVAKRSTIRRCSGWRVGLPTILFRIAYILGP
jgi:hypothetical protein